MSIWRHGISPILCIGPNASCDNNRERQGGFLRDAFELLQTHFVRVMAQFWTYPLGGIKIYAVPERERQPLNHHSSSTICGKKKEITHWYPTLTSDSPCHTVFRTCVLYCLCILTIHGLPRTSGQDWDTLMFLFCMDIYSLSMYLCFAKILVQRFSVIYWKG